MRCKVLIENNHFQNITMSTIFISNDSNDWYESGPVRDMTIRGNTFHITPVDDWEYRKPAIYIHPIPLGEKNSPVPIHKNITIEDNTFFMHHECVVSAENVENLIIQNNKIVNMRGNKLDKEIEQDVLFEFDTCKNVVISNNTYENQKRVYAKVKRMHEGDLMITEDLTMVADSMFW